jgi:CxxC motif-containing protein (DUF1111 family)
MGISLSQASAGDQIELGRQLFVHKWVVNDPLSPEGDGLGPLHNADSCVACHNLGATAGAGSAEHDVVLMTLGGNGTRRSTARKSPARVASAEKIHPAFSGREAASTVMLHKFGSDPGYERWRLSVLGFKLPANADSKNADDMRFAAAQLQSNAPHVVDVPRKDGIPLQISRRNTTPLFGAGLIDSISDKTLLDLAEKQARDFPDLKGRVARTASGRVGRFGWRGQVATLREFVLLACAMEVGLTNTSHRQALDPLDPRKKPPGNDLSREQCDALVAYVASRPAPVRLEPARPSDVRHVNRGEELFESCGCIACHVKDIGDVQGIYSDLLLHDMGTGLSDPIPAFPETGAVQTNAVCGRRTAQSSSSSAYGGGGGSVGSLSPEVLALRREWKTPPLWGVRDSAPYLHDGRARTLSEAITAHSGEAEFSVKKYRDLNFVARSDLEQFLKSLAIPQTIPADEPEPPG